VTATDTDTDVYFDMYDRDIYRSPHETYRRLRNEAPVYYNERYNFYALSHHDDLFEVLRDRDTFISGRGMSFNVISKPGLEMPSGLFINEDAPMHTMHRSIVSRLFTPRSVGGLEPQIRKLCEEIVDGLVGRDHFDFMRDFSLQLPVQVIGMLVGVPKKDQADLLAVFQKNLHHGSSNPEQDLMTGILESAAWFNDYLDWREKNPSDDVMTQLMKFEFEDDTGATRTLRREEIVTYLTLIASAGSDTTATAISWAGSLLSDHPDQRRELVDNPSLIPQAMEEVLRCEPPSYTYCRWVTKDVEFHGRTIPADSILVVLPGAANRDESKWEDSERFDIHREPQQIFTFSFGPHFCLGANLARLEARIALETILPRIPEWTVDYDGVVLTAGIDTRGWWNLPVNIP
jgi:cytochrome P450